MSLTFDENDVIYCDYIKNAKGLVSVQVNFKDGKTKTFEGDTITPELLSMCKSKESPTER